MSRSKAVARIIRAVCGAERAVLTVSAAGSPGDEYDDIAISLPRVIGGNGVLAQLQPRLSPSESEALERSTGVIRSALHSLK